MVILSAVLFIRELHVQIAAVVFGLLMVEAGIWKLSQLMLPSERQYNALRSEGDHFLMLIRHLNEEALTVKTDDTPENQRSFEEIRGAMHEAVERMANVAGKTDAELV